MWKLVLVVMAVSLAGVAAGAGEAAAPCCFTNPRYAGTCTVVPGPDESCASILGYLNNPNSTGKGYCGGTTLRGGWASVECKSSVSQKSTLSAPSKDATTTTSPEKK